MTDRTKYIVGTSGYSFTDWVGSFYPEGTQRGGMLDEYVRHFDTVELNFSYYRIPTAGTMSRISARTPDGFRFWVKANRKTTHEQDRSVAAEFLDALTPLAESGKLAGVLLQFPQSFHRTAGNRQYLGATIEDFSSVPPAWGGSAAIHGGGGGLPCPLAVEFRHHSWDHADTLAGLRDRNITLVIPDVPDLGGLYRPSAPAATNATGYLRLHSRQASKWYAGGAERYDYDYSTEELQTVLAEWSAVESEVDKIYTFFNNCHRGQAARNAEAFRRLMEQI